MHILTAHILQTSETLTQSRDFIGLAAAALAAMMATNASWKLTDRFMARRAAGED